jgi:hypothetical protein
LPLLVVVCYICIDSGGQKDFIFSLSQSSIIFAKFKRRRN